MRLHGAANLVEFDEERVVAVRRVDFHVFGTATVFTDETGDLALLVAGVQDVAPDTDRQHGNGDSPGRGDDSPATATDVVKVHRLADDEITVRVEATDQLVTVVIEIALDFEACLLYTSDAADE